MDEPGVHCAKWSKGDTKNQVSRGLIYIWNIKKKKFTFLVTRRRMVVTKCSNEEKKGILSKDTDFSYKTNKFRDLI